MKNTAYLALIAGVMGVALMGCTSSLASHHYRTKDAAQMLGTPGGKFYIASCTVKGFEKEKKPLITAAMLRKSLGASKKFGGLISTTSDDAVPVDIDVACVRTDGNGILADAYDVLSICTLTLFPLITSDAYAYVITVKNPVETHKTTLDFETRSWTSIGPIALIPVPGSGKCRGSEEEMLQYNREKLVEAVGFALLKEDFDEAKN